MQMNDKTECIFLNAKEAKKAEDKELEAFLAYVNGKAAATAFMKELDEEATRIKNREDWRLRSGIGNRRIINRYAYKS